MIRVVLFLCAVAVASLAAAWIAERPGSVTVTWMGWRIETSMLVLSAGLVALTAVLIFVWTILRFLLRSPRLARHALRARRQRKGQRALSKGLIALASGDLRAAQRFARDSARLAESEPLTLLLQAQTAQVAGDRAGADAAFRAMAGREETRLLGLRGLFVEADRRGDHEAALRHAEEASRVAPALPWAGQAMFEFRCASGDWQGALAALETNFRGGLLDRATHRRRRAVLLTARALDLEGRDAASAKSLAFEAVKLAPDLVPAATLAAHLAAESGEGRRAAKVLESAWRNAPHPDIADLYAHLRAGSSARERLTRVQALARTHPGDRESSLAIARAALDAKEFSSARAALSRLLESPTQRVAMLMAELEEAEHGDSGRAREWMGRAMRAPRDPIWTADGIISERWLPVSPVTGRLDAFVWKVPVAEIADAGPALDPRAESSASAVLAAPEVEVSEADSVAEEIVEDAPARNIAAQEGVATSAVSPATVGGPAILGPSAGARPASQPPRAAAVIPLIHAPDDPGPEPDRSESELRAAGAASRGPVP